MKPADMSAFGAAIALAIAIIAGPVWAQGQGQDGPTPVTVVTLEAQDVALTSMLPGRVAASAQAEVRPQVNGIITERLFDEGAAVEEGQALYRIEAATYQAALAQAEASMRQAQVQVDASQTELDRQSALRDRQVASERAFDDAVAARDAAQASLQVAEAERQRAQIDLDHTTIRARLSGEIGLSQTSQGALVTASQAQPLAVIRRIQPVYVDVTQSAADLLRWRRGNAAADLEAADRQVRLHLADGSVYDQTGMLTAAEPQVDPQTGVVVLRMEFDNPDQLLLPGMYVQVELPTETAQGVVLAPQEGVTRDRRGRPTAWVVNADDVVEERILTILQSRGADWVVSDGLSPGERMIVAGLQKTQPGATVAPEARTAETAPEPRAPAAEDTETADAGPADES